MQGRSFGAMTCLLLADLLGCAPAPSPSPVTPPPVPAEFQPWPDLVWQLADLPPRPVEFTVEHVSAITASAVSFVAVGSREVDGIADGTVWRSGDGETWEAIDDPVFDHVELVDVALAPTGFVALGVETTPGEEDHPTSVIFRSDDGSAWQRLPPLAATGDTYPRAIAGGRRGVIAVADDPGGGQSVWRAADDRSFMRVTLAGPAAGGLVDPQGVADGFVALAGSAETPTVLLSADGVSWTATPIDPPAKARGTKVVLGRWGTIVQGMGSGDCQAPCPARFFAWWSGGGGRWGALPADGPSSNGVSIVVPAGVHGVLAIDGADAWSSPDGWAWRPMPEPGDGSVTIDDAVVRGDVIVAVGTEPSEEDDSSVGRILVAR
jgi:hypothetical protein